MNLQVARERIGRKLSDVSEVATGVLRGVRRRGQQDFAAYVFDLNNQLPATVGNLSKYLDDVIGHTYFDQSASPDLRWNNYLYFVVERGATLDPDFVVAKRNLEADRSYARKYVVFEDDFDRILDELDSIAVVEKSASATDIVQIWVERLSAIGLDDVLDGDRPITDVVRSIASGTAKRSVRTRKVSGVETSQQLVSGHLASIDLSGFRQHPRQKHFEKLGKANLLFGTNGAGKTSFLEGLEFLFCGANRRSGSLRQSAVTGLLASGDAVKTSGNQPLSDFKTRQRLWYGSDDTSRQNNLPNQFARFNFLNTDAAAELSLFKDDPKTGPGSNADSLADLLSGHEATLMWRRIESVRKAVLDETRAKRAERAVAASDQNSNELQIKAIEAAPRQADAAFAVFSKDLQRIGWHVVPQEKQAVSMQLVEALSELASQLGVVRQLDWLQEAITETSIANQAVALKSALEKLRDVFSRINANERRRSVLVQQEELADARKTALAAIEPEAVNDLSQLSQQLRYLNEELARNARAFSVLPALEAPEGWENVWGIKSVEEAFDESKATLDALQGELSQAQRRLNALSATQSQLQTAMSQLRDWAHKVIEHHHSDANCPVCGTKFEPGELFRRMEELAVTPSADESSELRRQIDRLNSQQERVGKDKRWLEQLAKFTAVFLDSPATASVSEALLAAEKLAVQQKELVGSKHAAQARIEGYARIGLSLDRVRELCAANSGDTQQPTDLLDIGEARRRVEVFLQQVRHEVSLVEEEMARGATEARRYLTPLAIDDEQPLSSAIDLVRTRLSHTQRAVAVCGEVHRYANVQPSTDLVGLHGSMEAAVLGAKSVLSEIEKDASSDTRLKTLKEQRTQLEGRQTRLNGALDRLAGAHKILDDIIENHSLEAATTAVVAATHGVADSIFSRIHSPAEYQVTADANAPLSRRANSAPVQLNEVSTGQRAAYALSMFLAMNAQVTDGPKVILLDDPISHIDDLNALSFLDYLRNLVLKSDRQLFFATADEKVAGLFAHKFGFLRGDFRIIELARG
ncbi:exonuclease SbcC [Paraburkholderia atlantica]|uniref:hypothetical protein n=1 Tax=Paraburkholderia atlantica TaxID=2654982 RepID=UPI003D22F66A